MIDPLEPVRVPSCYKDNDGATHQTLEGAREANRVIAIAALMKSAATTADPLHLAIAKRLIQHKQAIIDLLNA